MKVANIPTVNRILKKEYLSHHVPVIELVKAQTNDPFKILIATILSARTKDQTTTSASQQLFKVIDTVKDLQKIKQSQLEKLIFPVGFYRAKAKHLKQLPSILNKKFKGIIPKNVEDLCELPGVGRKTANLIVAVAFDKPAVCVDVHVHRISNRLGLVKTKKPLKTEMALRNIMPVKYWKTWNSYLVAYGQRICTPISPKCSQCTIFNYCQRLGVKKQR